MSAHYVATFAFSPDLRKVVLIQKNRPPHLAGKWNAIGGAVEARDLGILAHAAGRELREEAGLYLSDVFTQLIPVGRVRRQAGLIDFYATTAVNVDFAQTKTDERVMVWDVATLHAYRNQLVDDLLPLLEMAQISLRHPGRTFFDDYEAA